MATYSDLTGKVVLITGSSGGLGAYMAKEFAKNGAEVVITGRNADNVAKVANECNEVSPNGKKALQVLGDVTKDEDLRNLINTTIEKLGRLDILVNNAGAGAFGSIYDPKLIDTLDHMMRLDVRSVVYLTHLAVPHLEKTKGVIVNISAVLSQKPSTHFMPYCIAKSALDMFTKCIAIELGPKGIRVNTVNPTAVRTNFQSATGAGAALDNFVNHLETIIPLRRIGTHEDVANAVLFLSSNKSSFVTGAGLFVDGGSIYV